MLKKKESVEEGLQEYSAKGDIQESRIFRVKTGMMQNVNL